jgi:hypothetical protein
VVPEKEDTYQLKKLVKKRNHRHSDTLNKKYSYVGNTH